MKKWVRLFGYNVYFWSYGHENVKNGSFFVFFPYNSKKLVTDWVEYLSASERSYLALSENGMGYCVLINH